MIVAVEENQITASQHGVGDNLVGGTRPVQDEVRFVGTEDTRRVPLCLSGWTFMNKQVSQAYVGVAQIVAKDALAKMLEEQLAGGRLAIELSTLVARAVERNFGLGIVSHQAAEERRQQLHSIVDETGEDLLGVKDWCLLSQVDVASDLAERIEAADVRNAMRVRESPQRRPEAGRTHRSRQRTSLFQLITIDHCDICTNRGILGNVALKALAYLNLEVFCSDPVQKLLDLRISVIDDGCHFQ